MMAVVVQRHLVQVFFSVIIVLLITENGLSVSGVSKLRTLPATASIEMINFY